jgi:hypothetical protein
MARPTQREEFNKRLEEAKKKCGLKAFLQDGTSKPWIPRTLHPDYDNYEKRRTTSRHGHYPHKFVAVRSPDRVKRNPGL